MEPTATIPLGRPLSADHQAAIKAFYKPDLSDVFGTGLFLPVALGMMAAIGFGMATELRRTEYMVPVGVGVGVMALVLVQLLLRWVSRRKMGRAEFIYQYGQAETITFAGLTTEEYRRNRRSQTVINLLRGNQPLKIRTFDDRIIAAFMPPQQVVYTHPSYPDVLVPGSLFTPGWSTGLGSKPRVVGV